MSTMSGVLVLTLPETNNQKLPDSLKEAQAQDRRETEESREKEIKDKDGENKTRL